jgi:site-specific recombinase XerD
MLNIKDLAAFQAVAQEAPQPARAILGLLAGCALRSAEVCSTTRVDLERLRETGMLYMIKKGGDQGAVPAPTWVREAVDDLLARRGRRWVTIGDLLARNAGACARRQALGRLVAWACRKAGMEEAGTPHEVRHNVAVEILRNGGTLEHVRRMLRHTGYGQLWRYAELSGEDLLAKRDLK